MTRTGLKVRRRSSSRPYGWERIETCTKQNPWSIIYVAPGLTAGRGLKQRKVQGLADGHDVAPGLTAGRGLKQL